MGSRRAWAGRSIRLASAFAWRTRREGLRYLLVGFAPFALVVAVLAILPSVTGGKGIHGAGDAMAVSVRYGSSSLAVGLLLTIAPGLVAVFGGIGIARVARGFTGAEVSRGGMELLLAAPYAPGEIAAAVLGYLLGAALTFWAGLTGMSALALAGLAVTSGGHLTLTGGYLLEALVLPLLALCASSGLALAANLLFPRLTQVQLGVGINLAGGSLDHLVSVLPAIALLLALVTGGESLAGSAGLFATAAGIAMALGAAGVAAVALGFRSESVLES